MQMYLLLIAKQSDQYPPHIEGPLRQVTDQLSLQRPTRNVSLSLVPGDCAPMCLKRSGSSCLLPLRTFGSLARRNDNECSSAVSAAEN